MLYGYYFRETGRESRVFNETTKIFFRPVSYLKFIPIFAPHFVTLNHTMINLKRFLFAAVFSALPLISNAAINAQINFENGIPKFVTAKGGASIITSTDRYKDGDHSLKFTWSGDSQIVISNFLDIEESMKVWKAGVIVWVYNPEPADQAFLRFSFKNWEEGDICYFDFYLNFQGWRPAWIRYEDMHISADQYYGNLPTAERSTAVSKMTITPVGLEQGTLYIDRLSFMKSRVHDQTCRDAQVPDNCNFLAKRSVWQWQEIWDWAQYPQVEPIAISSDQRKMMEEIASRMDKVYAKEFSGAQYVKGTLIPRTEDMFAKYGIRRLEDGTVIGSPLSYDDEFNNSLGEMRIRFIGQMIYWWAQDYYHTGNKSNIERVQLVMDHAIEQGFAYGCSLGTNHHYGYQIKELYKGLWIFRNEIPAEKMAEYQKVLEYWSGLAETRKPFVEGRDEILDCWNTLNDAKVIAAMLTADENMRYAKLKALGEWLASSLCYYPGTIGGFKVDGTSFHHGGHYPAYTVGAIATVGTWCYLVRGTDLIPSEDGRRVFKKVLMTMRNYTNLTDWGLTICGRHPFKGFIPKVDIECYANLALCGDLTGQGLAADPDLGGAYLYLGGDNSESVSALKKAKVSASAAPEGFFVLNYAAQGVHRRDGWMLSVKGFNTHVWGSECYAAENRYGRYLSYGAATIIGSGKPNSEKSSGYVEDGWDWNRIPGTTTVHLPIDILENPNKGTLMERNNSRFPGASSLEGRNGCLAFTYVEGDHPNFVVGATATKSIFCFDNRIIFLGTGITNNSDYPTETTLFQLYLEDKLEEIEINENWSTTFPYEYHHSTDDQAVLRDTKGNTYIVQHAKGLALIKQHQKSILNTKKKDSEGDFVSAYLNHGTSPKNASYEYMMLINAATKEVTKYSKKLPYSVLQRDNTAHIVNDFATGITAYICYGDYDGSASKDAFAALKKEKEAKAFVDIASITAETIVMERQVAAGQVVMSICTPDLGIYEVAYTTPEPSSVLKRTVVLDGVYSLANPNEKVELTTAGGKTTITAACQHGQPVEFHLNKQ